MTHVATQLPRLPSDLDVWQIFTPGSHNKVYKTPININRVVVALEWLRLNNHLCAARCVYRACMHSLWCTKTSSSAT